MKCPSCSAEASPGATSCAQCQAALPPSCHGCGAAVEPGVELCPACRTEPGLVVESSELLEEDDESLTPLPQPLATLASSVAAMPAAAEAGGAAAEARTEPLPSLPAGAVAEAAAAAEPTPAGDELASPTGDTAPLPDAAAIAVAAAADGAPVADSDGPTRPMNTPEVTAAMSVATHRDGPAAPAPIDGLAVAPAVAPAEPAAGARTAPMASASAAAAQPAVVDHLARYGELDLNPRLIGRSAVLERLRSLVERAAQDRDVIFAALVGTPGMGKSRLARELIPAVAMVLPEARVLIGRAGSRGAPPFTVFARLFAARFGVADDDPPELARAKINEQVSEVVPGNKAAEVAELLSRMVVPAPGEAEPGALPPAKSPQQDARTFVAVRRFFAAEAERAPLVLVFDDVHRASHDTVKLIHYLAAGLEGHPVVLLAVARPHLYSDHPSFAQESELERIEIGPLGPEESGQLFEELTRAAGEPPLALGRHVRDRLGGSPRALVELVRYLLETGGIKKIGNRYAFDRMRFARTTLAGGGAPLPGSIEEILAARLHLVDAARRDLLEKAASCGPIFWLDAVVALVRASTSADPDGPSLEEIAAAGATLRESLEESLDVLERRGIVVSQQHSRIPGEREYHFAYPPWWEVVDKGVAQQARRRYHKLVAQWLELRPEGRPEVAQEEVAHHLELAGDGDGAAIRYRRAAEAARVQYYNHAAIRLYGLALGCIGEGDVAARIGMWHDLGSVYQLVGEHESALRCFEKMLRLAFLVASRPKLAVAFNKIGRILRQRGELHRAHDHFERGLEMFRQSDDERGIAGSLDDIAQVLWLLGRYEDALDRGAAALERRRRLGDKSNIALSLLTVGHVERHRGLFYEAEACYREALTIRRALDDKAGIAAVLNGLGALAFQRGDYDGARANWEEALERSSEVGAHPLVAIMEAHLGEVARATGKQEEARARFERSEAAARDLDDKRLLSEALRNLSTLDLAAGDLDIAQERAAQALELAETAGIRVDVGRALIALGEIRAQTLFHAVTPEGDDTDGDGTAEPHASAEDFFRRAVELFRTIGNEAELGVALERFGTWRIERGDIETGRTLLGEAEEIFNRLGMKGLRRRRAAGDARAGVTTADGRAHLRTLAAGQEAR